MAERASTAPAPGRTARAIVVLVLLFAVVRAAQALALADVFYYGEELARGTAAKAMLDRLPTEHHTFAYWYYEGGAFAVAHLTALAFAVAGESLLAHKLAALCFGAAILCAGFAFTRRNFGARAAWLFGLLFVFSPAAFQKLSLLNLGTHFAATLFLFLILGQAFRIAVDGEMRVRRFVLLGLAAGFGFFFNYQTLPATAFAAGLILFHRWRELRAGLLGAGVLAFAIGLTPLWLMWLRVRWEIFNIHGTFLFAPADHPMSWGSIEGFARSVFANRSAFETVFLAFAFTAPLVGGAWLAFGRPVHRAHDRARALALLAYLAFFAAVYVKSGFQITSLYHYFTANRFSPFWALGTVLVAAAGARALAADVRRVRIAATAGLGLLLGGGVVDTVAVLREGRPSELVANARVLSGTKGYWYLEYLPYFDKHLDDDVATRLDIVLAFEEQQRDCLAIEAAQALLERCDLPLDELLAIFDTHTPADAADLRRGLGPYLVAQAGKDLATAIDAALAAPVEQRAWRIEALGRWGPGFYRGMADRSLAPGYAREASQVLPKLESATLREIYFRGMGHRVHRALKLHPDAAARAIGALPADIRAFVQEGYDEARRWNRLS